MIIVYLSSSTIPSHTANSIHVMKMCQALAKNGNKVYLVAPNKRYKDNIYIIEDEDVYEYYGVDKCFEIIKMPWFKGKGLGHLYGFLAALKAKSLKPDIIYGRNLTGCFFSTLLNLRVGYESHQPVIDSGKITEIFFRMMIKNKNFKKLVVISEALKIYYLNNYSIDHKDILVAHDGADLPRTNKKINLGKKHKFKVGYIGHLYPGKGMEVVSNLVKLTPWAEFHIVGGTERDIEKWKFKLKAYDNIVFHGFVDPGWIDVYHNSVDVLIAPYKQNVFGFGSKDIAQWMSPLKIFEYMASGKPIISSDVTVLQEILEDEKNALLCSPDDINCWVKALQRLKDDEALRNNLGVEAKQAFLNLYKWDMRAKRIISSINQT